MTQYISVERAVLVAISIGFLFSPHVVACQSDQSVAPELSAIASFMRKDKVKSPDFLLVDRLVFNGYLANLPKTFVVRARLKTKDIETIERLAKKRGDALTKSVQSYRSDWQDLTTEEKTRLANQAIQADEREVKVLVESLDEVLTPFQRNVLATAFLTDLSEHHCCDPIIRHWIGLTEQEANQFRERYEISSRFLVRTWSELRVPMSTPLPEEKESEYQRLYVLIWERLSPEVIKRILVCSSLLLDDEELADYVERSPRSADALIKYIPAFADSVKQRKQGIRPVNDACTCASS